jgi:hypothetical protein
LWITWNVCACSGDIVRTPMTQKTAQLKNDFAKDLLKSVVSCASALDMEIPR